MPVRSALYSGNSFPTTLDLETGPDWKPLEAVARLVRQSPELPQFHPGEFMYMATLHAVRQRVAIHLYKHIDTRHYLNLDDGGHAYAFEHRPTENHSPNFGGRYRRYRNLIDAIDGLDLQAFETGNLFRSFPPSEWHTAAWA
ncbi:MAG TPA: hypothetical protein PK020_07685 [Ilumatobacteraceae bacterium]|nr:hypothetical protein [Ilumatobacteraceae bacterium]HRB02822.1 hypothetical protein [Ilumatobacteraceae bacterium]